LHSNVVPEDISAVDLVSLCGVHLDPKLAGCISTFSFFRFTLPGTLELVKCTLAAVHTPAEERGEGWQVSVV